MQEEKKAMKKRYQFIIGQALLVCGLVIVQIGLQFAQTHKWVGFVAKDESNWIGIAEVAQADRNTCLEEVEQLKAEKAEAIKANNLDLYQ